MLYSKPYSTLSDQFYQCPTNVLPNDEQEIENNQSK